MGNKAMGNKAMGNMEMMAGRVIVLVLWLLGIAAGQVCGAEERLLSANFDNCDGKAPDGDTAGCASVMVEGENRMAGVASLAGLPDKPLQFAKNDGGIKGKPQINWRLDDVASGVLRFEWDVVVTGFTAGTKYPGSEHLLCLNVIGSRGRVIQAVRMAAKGGGGEGVFDLLGKDALCGTWSLDKAQHVIFDLDLEKKACSLTVDGKLEIENVAFEGGPVLGFNFRDGGGWGCFDSTFSAGIDNLKVTHITAGSAAASAEKRIRVACCGDSITLGVGVDNPATRSYPALLQAMLGDRYEVKNFGAGGRTLLRKADAYDIGGALKFRPDIVIINLGTNDSKAKTWQAHGAEFVTDYAGILQAFRKLPTNPKIYICLPTPMFPGRWDLREELLTANTIPAIRKVAAENPVTLIDLYTPFAGRKELFPDTVHPNNAGAAKIAEVVGGALSTPAAAEEKK